jgi:hypothetical protein
MFVSGDDFPNMEALLEQVFEIPSAHGSARHLASGEPGPSNTGLEFKLYFVFI